MWILKSLSPLEEQHVFLTTEQSPHLHNFYSNLEINIKNILVREKRQEGKKEMLL